MVLSELLRSGACTMHPASVLMYGWSFVWIGSSILIGSYRVYTFLMPLYDLYDLVCGQIQLVSQGYTPGQRHQAPAPSTTCHRAERTVTTPRSGVRPGARSHSGRSLRNTSAQPITPTATHRQRPQHSQNAYFHPPTAHRHNPCHWAATSTPRPRAKGRATGKPQSERLLLLKSHLTTDSTHTAYRSTLQPPSMRRDSHTSSTGGRPRFTYLPSQLARSTR